MAGAIIAPLEKLDAPKSLDFVHKIEGWPGEPDWRYEAIRNLVAFVERQTGKDLGSEHMMKSEK